MKKKKLTTDDLLRIVEEVEEYRVVEPLVVKTKEQVKQFNAQDRALAKLFGSHYKPHWKIGSKYYLFQPPKSLTKGK